MGCVPSKVSFHQGGRGTAAAAGAATARSYRPSLPSACSECTEDQLTSSGSGWSSASPGPAPVPALGAEEKEAARLASLEQLEVHSFNEPRFACIVKLLKTVFQVEAAMVALVGSEDIHFAAAAGAVPPSTPRPGSFCEWCLRHPHPSVMMVEDATQDERFKGDARVVGPPFLRFYAGAPLVSTELGHVYGTLCMIGFAPRRLNQEQLAMLAHFAELVTRELERDKVLHWRQQALRACLQRQRQLRALDCFAEGICLLDCSQPQWPVLYSNSAFQALAGAGAGAGHAAACPEEPLPQDGPQSFWRFFAPTPPPAPPQPPLPGAGPAAPEAAVAEARINACVAAAEGRDFHVAVERCGAAGAAGPAGSAGQEAQASAAPLSFHLRPAGVADPLRPDIPKILLPAGVDGAGGLGPAGGGGAVPGRRPASAAVPAPLYYFAVTTQGAA